MSSNGRNKHKSQNSQTKSEEATNTIPSYNPEILGASPRPGGYIKHRVPTRSEDFIVDSDDEGHHCICTEGASTSASSASRR